MSLGARGYGGGHLADRSRLCMALLASTALTAISLIVAMPQARAQVSTWQLGGVNNASYNAASNWDTNTVPGQGNADDANFAATGSTTVVVNAAVAPRGWAFTANAQSYTISGANVTFGNTGLANNSNANQSIANTLGGNGEIIQTGTGTLTLTAAGSSIGGNLTNSSTGAVTINGGSLAVGGQALIAQGALTVSSSGTLTSGSANIGFGSGASATALVTGAGSTWTATNGIVVGNASGPGGVGTLTVADGGRAVVSNPNQVILLDAGSRLNLGNGGLAGSVDTSQITLNGSTSQIVANFTDTSTLSADVVGDGSLTKQGTGTLILTSNLNSYTGGTTISGGTLQLGNGGNTGFISGNVANNSVLAINRAGGSSQLTLAGVISGTGSLQQDGGGTTVLTGANTYTGGTTVNQGTLQIGDTTTTGAIVRAITSNDMLSFVNADTSGITSITNNAVTEFRNATSAGSAAIANNGFLDFRGSSTAGNATITNNFALEFFNTSTAGNAAITASAASGVFFSGNSTAGTAQLIANSGGFFDFDGTTGPNGDGRVTAGSLAGAGNFYLGNNRLSVGSNNMSTGVSGVIADGTFCGCGGTGASLEKVGTGTLTLSGVNTYTGGTVVSGGTLAVDGSIATSSGVDVNNGGTVGGTGTLGTTRINAGGTLSPGNGIGSIAVAGNLAFASAANYLVQVSPATADRTNVSGTAALGGTVQASFQSGSYIARSYTILSAAGGRGATTFNALTTANLPSNFSASLSYTTTDVLLNLAFAISDQPGLTGNQVGVAEGLENAFQGNGGIPAAFADLSASNLSQLSGEQAAGAQQAGMQATSSFLSLLLDPFGGMSDDNNAALSYARAFGPAGNGLSREKAEAYAAVTPKDRALAPEQRWNIWGATFGGSNKVDGDPVAGSNDTTSHVYGIATGADYRVSPDTMFGFAVAGGGTSWGLAQGLGGGSSDMLQAGVYGSKKVGAAYLSAALAAARFGTDTNRTVTVFGVDKLVANFNAYGFGGRVETGYRFATSAADITPYAALQVQNFRTPAYSERVESGSGAFALTYESQSATATRTELGAWFGEDIMLARGNALALGGCLAWAHDHNNDSRISAVFQTLPGSNFAVSGATAPSDYALISAGAELRLSNNISLGAKFSGEFADRAQTYAGTGTIRYVW